MLNNLDIHNVGAIWSWLAQFLFQIWHVLSIAINILHFILLHCFSSCVSFPSEDWEIADSTVQFWYSFFLSFFLSYYASFQTCRLFLFFSVILAERFLLASELRLMSIFPYLRSGFATYIISLDENRQNDRNRVKDIFLPVFSALVDALVLRSQVTS